MSYAFFFLLQLRCCGLTEFRRPLDRSERSQQALARLAQEDSWPELAHALVLAEEDINSPSSNSRVGFRPDVLVTCQGGSNMLQMLAEALVSACVELQRSGQHVSGVLQRVAATLACVPTWHLSSELARSWQDQHPGCNRNRPTFNPASD
jgi:hypothetical protein